jgi:hypothetical protein
MLRAATSALEQPLLDQANRGIPGDGEPEQGTAGTIGCNTVRVALGWQTGRHGNSKRLAAEERGNGSHLSHAMQRVWQMRL